MPQLFHVLRCYKCSVFQVHQTNKSNKWECKVCGVKQSVKRFYGLGTAKECRFHVLKLNGMRGEIDRQKNSDCYSDSSQDDETVTEPIKDNLAHVKVSKWAQYVEETETDEENTNRNMTLGGSEVVLEIPKKRRKLTADHLKLNENYKNHPASSAIVPNSSVNVGSIQSKTQKPSFYVEDIIPEEQAMDKKLSKVKKIIAPKINENSKWAQFTEEQDETEQTDSTAITKSLDATRDFFSWCDEKDLDFILDV